MKDRLTNKDWIRIGIIVLIMFGFYQTCISQAISITQDPKLALIGDERGNDAFTADLRIKLHLEGQQRGPGFLTVNILHEYADLKPKNYNRYGFQVGFTFNRLFGSDNNSGFFVTPLAGYGVLMRGSAAVQSWEFEIEFGYMITDHFGVMVSGTYTQRAEYKTIFWRESGYIGLIGRL